MEKNAKALNRKSTKLNNIQYFFITNRVKNDKVSVFWCPTGDFIGDYVTKPLQGVMFRMVRDQNIGLIKDADQCPGKFKV